MGSSDIFSRISSARKVLTGAIAAERASADSQRAQVHYEIGLIEERRGFTDTAKDRFQQAAQLGHPEAAQKLGGTPLKQTPENKPSPKAASPAKPVSQSKPLPKPAPQEAPRHRTPEEHFQAALRYAQREDYAGAVPDLQAAAKGDHPKALYLLGALYLKGAGVPADAQEGTLLIRRAADLGLEEAKKLFREEPAPAPKPVPKPQAKKRAGFDPPLSKIEEQIQSAVGAYRRGDTDGMIAGFSAAAKLGHARSAYILAEYYNRFEIQRLTEAEYWCETAIKLKAPGAKELRRQIWLNLAAFHEQEAKKCWDALFFKCFETKGFEEARKNAYQDPALLEHWEKASSIRKALIGDGHDWSKDWFLQYFFWELSSRTGQQGRDYQTGLKYAYDLLDQGASGGFYINDFIIRQYHFQQGIQYANSNNHPAAARSFRKAAEKGSKEAMFNTALSLFKNPAKTRADMQEALDWLAKAKEKGYMGGDNLTRTIRSVLDHGSY